jgi:hypothetical protein
MEMVLLVPNLLLFHDVPIKLLVTTMRKPTPTMDHALSLKVVTTGVLELQVHLNPRMHVVSVDEMILLVLTVHEHPMEMQL